MHACVFNNIGLLGISHVTLGFLCIHGATVVPRVKEVNPGKQEQI